VTWPGISTCVRECARAGSRWVAGKAELTKGSHDAARGNGRARETVQRADEPARQRGKGAHGRGQLALTEWPHWAEGEEEKERTERKHC
jgi:hypothetical protein